MAQPALVRYVSSGVTLLGDTGCPGGVTFGFTERTGGVSRGPFSTLNIGGSCGDDPSCVSENRRRVLDAIGARDCAGALVMPHQVHGDVIVTVDEPAPARVAEARAAASAGADAIVCTVAHVPVMLQFADCVPVVLAAPSAFAVVHSGWRGTLARISGKATVALASAAGCAARDVTAYVGPHITVGDYEVSPELAATFSSEFGNMVVRRSRMLDLSYAIRRTLEDEGVPAGSIVDPELSTASNTDRFYSYRAEGGTCGRHGAIAYLP
jgi:YfiH family protein